MTHSDRSPAPGGWIAGRFNSSGLGAVASSFATTGVMASRMGAILLHGQTGCVAVERHTVAHLEASVRSSTAVPLNRRPALVAGYVLAGLFLPAPTLAASPGVHLDPNSPSAKEYAIPIVAARNEGSAAPARASTGTSSGNGGSSKPTAPAADSRLFGQGITRPVSPRPPGSSPKRAKTAAPASPVGIAPPQATVTSERRRADGGGGSSAIFWVGTALALLVPGAAVGFGVRRWRHA